MATQFTTNAKYPYWQRGDRDWDVQFAQLTALLDASCLNELVVTFAAIDAAGVSTSLAVTLSEGVMIASNGTAIVVAAIATITLGASVTSYLYLDDTGTLVVNTTGFPASVNIVPLAVVTTGATTVTSIDDQRRVFLSAGALRAATSVFVASGVGHATGLVPDPGATAGATKYLREDATWDVPPGVSSSTPVFIASGGGHAIGLVPDPGATAGATKYLREDATWDVPPIGPSYAVFVASGGAHAIGLVPDPGATAGAVKYLREDATWGIPPGATSGMALGGVIGDALPSVSGILYVNALGNLAEDVNFNRDPGNEQVVIGASSSSYYGLVVARPLMTSGDLAWNVTSIDPASEAIGVGGGFAMGGYISGVETIFGGFRAVKENATVGNHSSRFLISLVTTGSYTPSDVAEWTSGGSFVANLSSPISLVATEGFSYLPQFSGTPPTGVPVLHPGAAIAVDSLFRIFIYNRTASAWQNVAGAAAATFVASGVGHAPGLVPDPGATAGATKYLREDATWDVPPYPAVFVASGGGHTSGLVPDPGATAGATKYLREDATWDVPSNPVFLASGVSHAAGIVPDPGVTAGTLRFLNENATWQTPPVFIGSGGTHRIGYVPDPGATAGATKYLCEDATWSVPSGGSGVTGSRPTTTTVGRQWFDTTLGKPIWWNGSAWVDATGTVV